MLATLAEMTTSVRYLIKEATASFWSDAEIATYLNEAQEIFATETKCLSKYYSHTLLAADIKHDREIRLNSDFVALDVMNSILGGSFGSRITSNIREDKGYTYSPRSTVDSRYKSAIWYEQADVTTEFTGASLQEITKEIERLQNEAPSKEELDGIKNYEAGLFVLLNSTPAGIIGQLVFLDTHELEDDFLINKVQS